MSARSPTRPKARTAAKSDAAAQLPHQPKAGYHHGDLSRALVVAATRLVEAGGGGRLTLRAAAQAAGVSVAAPYRHFADREALLAAVLAEGFLELARRTDAARLAAPDPLAALAATGLAYVQFAAAHPRTYRLMFGPECDKASHPALMQAGHAARGVLHQAVADCAAAGLLRPSANVQQVALAGWSLTHGLASLYVDGLLAGTPASQDLAATAQALNAMLLAGVRKAD